MKQHEMANWLKGITIFTGVVGLIILVAIIPTVVVGFITLNDKLFQPMTLFIWGSAMPVYICLFKVWQMCKNIENNNSFCHQNAKLLKEISLLAILDTVLYLISLAFFMDNILYILFVMCVVAVGIFMAVLTVALSHLTTKAAVIKAENDLTI